MERRLTAILAADIVGYTRLMGADELGTLQRLTELRQQTLEPLIANHDGRIVKLMGDGILMEFSSAVEVVAFAAEVQCAMSERNAEIPKNRRIVFRIGINVGDIVIEDDDIFGDGVNIAARLEGLAEPGGICVARNDFATRTSWVQHKCYTTFLSSSLLCNQSQLLPAICLKSTLSVRL